MPKKKTGKQSNPQDTISKIQKEANNNKESNENNNDSGNELDDLQQNDVVNEQEKKTYKKVKNLKELLAEKETKDITLPQKKPENQVKKKENKNNFDKPKFTNSKIIEGNNFVKIKTEQIEEKNKLEEFKGVTGKLVSGNDPNIKSTKSYLDKEVKKVYSEDIQETNIEKPQFKSNITNNFVKLNKEEDVSLK